MNTMNTMVNKSLALVIGASILSMGIGGTAAAAFYSSRVLCRKMPQVCFFRT